MSADGRVRVLTLGALLLTGCGPEAVLWVKVGAPLVCPKQCDTLRIDIAHPDGGSVLQADYDLRNRTPSFPQSTTFSTSDNQLLEAPGLRVSVSVLQNAALAAPWAGFTADVVLHSGRTTVLDVPLHAPL